MKYLPIILLLCLILGLDDDDVGIRHASLINSRMLLTAKVAALAFILDEQNPNPVFMLTRSEEEIEINIKIQCQCRNDDAGGDDTHLERSARIGTGS